MLSFSAILLDNPNGAGFQKIAAFLDDVNGVLYPLELDPDSPPTAVAIDSMASDTTGEFVVLTFTGPISATPVPAPSEFAYTADAVTVAVTDVEVTGQSELTLTLETPAENGETLTLGYTAGTLLSLNGQPVATSAPASVTNNVP